MIKTIWVKQTFIRHEEDSNGNNTPVYIYQVKRAKNTTLFTIGENLTKTTIDDLIKNHSMNIEISDT